MLVPKPRGRTMIYDAIRYETSGDVAILILNRPDVMNALTSALRRDLLHAITHASQTARAIVITGAGRAYCSGQDLADATTLGAADFERLLRLEYEPLLRAIYDCPIPTISAVNGAAAGAGANLALAADVVIAAHSASFIQSFTRIGLIPMQAAPIGCHARSACPAPWGQPCSPTKSPLPKPPNGA